MNPTEIYIHDRDEQVRKNMEDVGLKDNTSRYFSELVRINYSKTYTWLGIPIIQCPTDLMVMQELIWQIKPDFIIETGVAHGGMTRFYATILKAIGNGKVLGIDIDIREHAWKNKDDDNLRYWIEFFQDDSTDPKLIQFVESIVRGKTVMVSLDSCHSHEHVLKELFLYAPMVSVGSYIVVFDTAIEYFAPLEKDRPWGKGNNPWTAVQEFMKGNEEFVVDREVEQRALLTAAPGGFLRRIKKKT